MRRRFHVRTFVENTAVIGGVALIVLVVSNIIAFSSTRTLLPPGSRLGQIDISGITIDDALSKTVAAIDAPVTLHARQGVSVSLALRPGDVDFQLNPAIARLQLQAAIDRQQGLIHLPAFMLRQYGPAASIPLPYQYSQVKLKAFLDTLAHQINRAPHDPSPDLSSARVISAQAGITLNMAEAEHDIVTALASLEARDIDLPIDVVTQPDIDVRALAPVLEERLKPFTSIDGHVGAVFIKDLHSGKELNINADVAVSAAHWVMLALALEGVRATAPSTATGLALAAPSVPKDAVAADALLLALGGGDAQAGTERLNAMLNKTGLRNTFLAQPFSLALRPPTIATPANMRGDVNAAPDSRAQSTVADMGVLLEMLTECTVGQGTLPFIYTDSLGKDKCTAVMQSAAAGNSAALLRAGSANSGGTDCLAWDDFNHGDAAVVVSPKRTYIVVVMLHSSEKLNWADTSPIISDIARLTYGFFNGSLPPTVAPLTGPPAS